MAVLLVTGSTLVGCGGDAQEKPKAPDSRATVAPSAPLVELRIEPLPDYFFFLRRATHDELVNVPSFLGDALRELKAIDAVIGDNATLWEKLEAPLGGAHAAAELEGAYDTVPLEIEKDGEKIHFRDLVRAFHRAFREGEPGFIAQVWPAHKKLLEARRATYRQEAYPVQAKIAASLEKKLGVRTSKTPPPVFMVVESPHAFVHAETPEGAELNAVATNGAGNRELVEETVHAFIRAEEKRSRGTGTIFEDLQRELRGAGVDDTGKASVPSVIALSVYAEASEAVRATLDPNYTPLGTTNETYAAHEPVTSAVLPAWKRFDREEIGRAQLVSDVVSHVAPLARAEKEEKAKKAAAKIAAEKAEADKRAKEAKDKEDAEKAAAKPGGKGPANGSNTTTPAKPASTAKPKDAGAPAGAPKTQTTR